MMAERGGHSVLILRPRYGFVAEVPPPLAIGTVTLKSGEQVKGFEAEPRAVVSATDITDLGGWRAYISSKL